MDEIHFVIEERLAMMTEGGSAITAYHESLIAEQVMAEFGVGYDTALALTREATRPRAKAAGA